ncbi:MAG TPA: thiamine pyrophosphate-dependent enzyme [Candidatus Angelobacter sp.]|nr:thiamine pyrophosphate-dependent enzyme [Candidatus Angelobacter sp.]
MPVLNADKLKELFATMVKCRMLTERVQSDHAVKRSGNSVLGFEATLVGAGAHLLPKDCIAMEHSSFVASLIKGTPLHSILAPNSQNQSGNGAGKAASTDDGNIAAALSMKNVLPLAAEIKGQGAVVLMFCTHNPDTLVFDSEAMAIAARQKLPLVCLVETSLDSPLELPNQVASGPYIGADPTFYPRIPVDGCDVVGVFRVAQEAIRRAREGHGPAVIKCLTARSSTAGKNASKQTSAQYLAEDPLSFMEQYLRRRDLWPDEWPRSIIEEFKRHLTEAAASLESPSDAEQFESANSPHPAAASAR